MNISRIWAGVLIGAAVTGGIVCSTRPASAQESALVESKERARKAPMNVDAALSYGRALRRSGRDAEAMTELRRAQTFARDRGEASRTVDVDWEIARTSIARRDFSGAMNACGVMKKRPAGAAAGHVCAAEAHLLWRRGSEALVEIAEVAKIKDAPADVLYFARIAEGRARDLDAKLVDAEACFREAMRLAPTRSEAPLFLGAMLARGGKDGLPLLRQAAELDPHDPVVALELGRALAVVEPAEAIKAYEHAVAERPAYLEALRPLTEAYVAADRLADAKRTASEILRAAPNDVVAHVVAGRVALAESRAEDALRGRRDRAEADAQRGLGEAARRRRLREEGGDRPRPRGLPEGERARSTRPDGAGPRGQGVPRGEPSHEREGLRQARRDGFSRKRTGVGGRGRRAPC